MRTAIKLAQRAVKCTDDGILGVKSIKAINSANSDSFSNIYDKLEISEYKDIVKHNPKLAKNLNGWINRAKNI